MPWYDNLIPDSIKKSVCSCLIKRYLSDFIENEITRDQLNLDLYNGRATAERISLAVESLNELGEAQNWPIELVDGYIDKIHISIPWTSLFSNSTEIEICGLKLTVQPKQRNEDATSMFESMWNSMSSSMQLAQEIAKETSSKRPTDNNQPIEGIELFAQTIDTVVKRIKIKLTDTNFQIEHLPKQCEKGVGLLVHVDCMEYYDDFSIENQDNQGTSDPSKEDTKKAYLVDVVTTKNVIISGIELSTVEFSSGERTVSRSLYREDERDDNESATDTDSDTETPQSVHEESPDRHVILCGKCFNNQEVKIRLKQSENTNGPKIAIELNLGSLVLFLSPRQFHILLQLIDGFSSPHMEDNSNVFHKNPQPTRMTEKDYERVEQELIQMMAQNRQYGNFGLTQGGWSTGAMDESSLSDYIPAQAATSTMYDSTMSGCSSSMESSITSSMVSSVTDASSHFRRRVSNIDSDPTAEISHFQVRFATFVGVLLHEDLLVQTSGNDKTLVWQMQSLAEKFFSSIDQSTFIGVSSDGFDLIHKSLETGCNLNHLRLLACPLKLEGSETTTSSAFSMSGHLIASKLELVECLFNDSFKYIPLVSFESSLTANTLSSARPNLSLKFKHVQKTGKGQYRRRGPKTEVSVNLDSCSVELDLSLVDRISSLLNHPTICTAQNKEPTPGLSAPQYSTETAAKSVQDFKISCPLFKLKLRFPIPDFRPTTDMSKPPWWERNVRPDYLMLVLRNATFRTILQTDQSHNEYNVECKLLDIFYYENENDHTVGMHIARCGLEDGPLVSMQDDSAFLTKLAIKIYPKSTGDDENLIPIDPMTHSFYGAFQYQDNPDPGPFGTKRVVHKSDTPHDNIKKEEQVIPGDKSEMEAFASFAMSNTKILVEVSLPLVSILLESKHMYELIYNRISNDLLLWQPQAPKPNISNNLIRQFESVALDQNYILADSGLRNDSDSDDLSEDELESNVFYSAYGSKMKNSSQSNSKMTVKKCRNGQCNFVMSLNIGEGIVSLNPPVRDNLSNVIPGQQGELALHINNSKVFIVSGYKGDDDLGYVSVQVDDAQLYHCDIQPTPRTSPPLREVGTPLGSLLVPTIYRSDKKSILSCESRAGERQMFTVAIKIQANHETHHVKVITVSLGLNRATLRHKMVANPNTWISHLIDFFNVQDELIQGYIPKDVLTELHLHIWDCAIDYRPLNLPLRSVVTIGSFSLSSHLTAVANTSTLTMIFEDCGMFLSDKAPPRNGVPSNVEVDLKRDYVNVMELALFELSIKTTDKQSGITPHIDLRMSINNLIVRTCSDTGRALIQILIYYINDGDLIEETQQPESTQSSPAGVMEDELIRLEMEEHSLTKSQQDQISEMLVDAMTESPKSNKCNNPMCRGPGAKLFYFPDEKEALETLPSSSVPQLIADLGDLKEGHFACSSDSDDDFCILGDDDMLPKSKAPEITWFSQDVRLVENYMAKPDSKRDVLAAPKSFPTPVTRYTLCDMSIVWQMFGGNDFTKNVKEDQKKEVRFADRQLGDSVSFSTKDRSKVHFKKSEGVCVQDLSWIQKGGVHRDHTVLMELKLSKVKFSHEVYPETSRQASRQVLSVFNIEIQDKLAASRINKFLYQYSSHDLPRQSNTNMVLIKALHSRPDPKVKQEECNLKISLMPIRLNIDQDSLFFLIKFFKELSGESVDEPVASSPKEGSLQSNISHHPPIMTTSLVSDREIEQKAKEVVTENLILLESRYHMDPDELTEPITPGGPSNDTSPIYFRSVEFTKDVLIRLDYIAKRVDMSRGPIAGFLMGLTYLKCSEIRLKRIVHRHGLLGFNKLIEFLLQEWIADIKKNQLSTILGGVGPMKAVIQLFQGVFDLFWLPIQQYQKDGRIVRGLQKGANSFTTSTAMAALELTSRLIYFIQITAETAYDMLSPGPSLRTRRLAKSKERKKRYNQPQDIREGLTNACMVVKEGIGETVDNIMQVAALENEQKGISGAVGAVIRQIPPTIFKPVIIATDATHNLVSGLQSQLVPDARKEANEKWRSEL